MAALEQARQGRLYILERMNAALTTARATMSSYAPRIVTIRIPVDKIRDVIGPGGKMIRSIVERTGTPKTRERLERAGTQVVEYEGQEISLKGGGGSTCLTRLLASVG